MDGAAQSGHRALRRARFSASGQIYLVTATTLLHERIFGRFDIACAAARVIAAPRAEYTVLCWVLMPDHLHALIELHQGTISEAARSIKGRSARAVNVLRETRGSVWAAAFHDRALRRDDDVVDFARYIVCNPVRAGLVRSIRRYAFWDAIWIEK
jgi:REP element-mobilizing transposase RayT